ncbi:uncharacterized protein LOC130137389 [Syzygium oleosum]|uniref:uncharacterized protein LOC130137389 n=1 Tax=Syzygium oleosum TaxID=219896 RepID=UPI0024BB6A72|nr:uncharacterized protein LOC130137389 [Syzygium oleosum]
MAGVSDPQPDKILNDPQNGPLTFLFRKKLTRSDFIRGLVLTVYSNYHLRNLPRPLLDLIAEDGLAVWCYTPAIHHDGIILKTNPDMTNFRFQKSGWDQIVVANRFLIGQEIDCWSLYDAEDGLHGNLSFLIQSVGDYVVPHEAASGEETETSSGS